MSDTPPPIDLPKNDCDQQMQNLYHQIASLEDFANAVVEQRNIAYNELAQYKAQILRQSKNQGV